MIFVGVIIITGLLLIAAHVAHSLHRRAQLVDRQKEGLMLRRKQIHQQDQQLTNLLTDSIIDGKSLADLVPGFVKQRGALLSEKGPGAGNWTPADVDAVMNDELQKGVGRINTKIALSVSLVAIMLIVLTIISAASLYAFIEGTSQEPASPAAPDAVVETYDPFAIEPFNSEGNNP